MEQEYKTITLPEQAVKEFQEICKKTLGTELAYEEALSQAVNLLALFDVIQK